MASDDEVYSDLTELESDDEYAETTKKKGKKGAYTGWRIRNALKVPRATTYTAQALYGAYQIYGCDINLEPEYQRDVVWSEAKQIGIIDSVFRNFYIPPVIFAVNAQEDGSETKTCIDGKQRLTSIHKFMEGIVHSPCFSSKNAHMNPFMCSLTGEKLYYKDIGASGPKRRLLPEKYRRLFANKQIVCVEYQDITDSDEREIFQQRVQLGMALTPAEKLQVVKTPRTDFIRDLQNQYAKEDGWLGPKHLAWDVSRGSDFRGIANAVCCMETYANLKALMSMPQLEKWLSIDEPLKASTQKSVEEAFRLFAEIVQDKKLSKVLRTPAKISPVEFIGISILIYAFRDKATLAQLAAGIADMRRDVRDQHVDIRMNTRVSKTIVDFVKKWSPTKVSGDKGGVASTLKSSSSTKRKRAKDANDDDDDDDEDFEMDVDDDAAYVPKAKKKNVGKSANAEASTSKATPPLQVKHEKANSPTISADPPRKALPTDRMTAIKAAKARIAHDQAERAKQLPTAPRALRGEGTHNPQMLPSPTQSFALPVNLAAALNRPSAAAAAVHSPTRDYASRPGHLPPPPASGGTAGSDGTYRNGDRDRAKDRERGFEDDRDANRARPRSREREAGYPRGRDDRGGAWDPRDQPPPRRDSGSYSSSTRWPPR
ncbi:hypothetical protein HYPSUDRAFT_147982 [Hypholoma sublateritium FD-334 SS-4]|uniref:GmrSD restriction endonucleases N-terminal domain-containing protein n=1 Tax=Hypholoma sublateritium (strain FD-334 SS-4) TaxID=945553 RepID=A0A0D2KNR1_HYPSF|nr:hypothetical protein HYPSUDRAFT_147982 [Hypholoma sublateritium FD-334 SS-4]